MTASPRLPADPAPENPSLMEPDAYRASLRRFYLTQVLWNLMFFMPTWVIFLQERHGLSLTQVTLIDLAFWLTMALTEVPTGAVADTFGRKPSILIGIGLSAFSVTLFGLAPNFALFLIANSLWGVAITFISGADVAFLFDTLRAQGRSGEYARVRGRLSALALAGGAIGNFAGGALASLNLASPFWTYGLVLGVALLVGLGLKEPPRHIHPATGKPPRYAEILQQALQAIRSEKRLRLTLLYSNLLPVANMLVTTVFIQPHLRGIGVPLVWMGGILFAFSLVRIAASSSAGRVARMGGRWLWTAPWLLMVGLLGLASIPNLAGVAIFGATLFTSVASRPMLEELILLDAPEATRATILSVDNLIFRVFLFVLEPAGGFLADRLGLPVLFYSMAVGIWLALMAILFLWRPERFGLRAVKTGV